MKNARLTVAVDQQTAKKVDDYASSNGLKTANTLLAAAAVEFAKAAEKGLNVWHVLGRIAADDEVSEQRPRIGAPSRTLTEAR